MDILINIIGWIYIGSIIGGLASILGFWALKAAHYVIYAFYVDDNNKISFIPDEKFNLIQETKNKETIGEPSLRKDIIVTFFGLVLPIVNFAFAFTSLASIIVTLIRNEREV